MSLDQQLTDAINAQNNLTQTVTSSVAHLTQLVTLKLVPAGCIAYFARDTAPEGWLKCNGAVVARSTYADLFAAIGISFGASTGSTTFNLPDLRGEFVRGWDDGRGVDVGRGLGSGQTSQNLAHTHTVNDQGNNLTQWLAFARGDIDPSADTSAGYSGSGADDRFFTINSSGGSESRPRNIALLACIKY